MVLNNFFVHKIYYTIMNGSRLPVKTHIARCALLGHLVKYLFCVHHIVYSLFCAELKKRVCIAKRTVHYPNKSLLFLPLCCEGDNEVGLERDEVRDAFPVGRENSVFDLFACCITNWFFFYLSVIITYWPFVLFRLSHTRYIQALAVCCCLVSSH